MPRFDHDLLRTVRLDLGMTQEQAASALGVDVRTYRRYESGAVNDGGAFAVRSAARRQLLRRMCEQFGVADESAWLRDAAAAAAAVAAPPPPAVPDPPRGLPPPLAPAAPRWSVRLAHPLQPAPHFVGRAERLAWLRDWYGRHADPAAPRVVALQAVGGAGKTALLERFVRELPAAPPGGVFVWSFYDDRRTEALLAQALSYFSVLAPQDALARGGGGAAAGAAPSAGGEGGALDRLLDALRDGAPHLIVLDGVEAVQSEGGDDRALGELCDPLVRRLLRTIAAGLGATRALLTSRLPLSDLAPWQAAGSALAAPLADLGPDDARALLRAWGLRGDDASLGALLAGVGCHALSVAMLGSYVGAFLDGDPARVAPEGLLAHDAGRDDPLARRLAGVLATYAAALAPAERDLLARVALFANGVEPSLLARLAAAGGEVAGALAGCDEGEVLRLGARLERLGLLFRARRESAGATAAAAASTVAGSNALGTTATPATPRARPTAGVAWAAHPFVREHFKSRLGAGALRGVHAAARDELVAGLAGAPGDAPGDRARDPAVLDRYDAVLEHALAAGDVDAAWAVYDRAMGGFAHLGLRLGAMARGLRAVRRFARGEDPQRVTPALDPSRQAAVLYEWGLYAAALGDLKGAQRCYEEHARVVAAAGAAGVLAPERVASLRAMSLRTLGYTHWLAGALEDADAALTLSLAIAAASGDAFHQLRGLALCAAVAHDRGRARDTDRHLAALRAIDPAPPLARRALWEAGIALDRGDHATAAQLARSCLVESARRGWAGHVAHARVVLGEAALASGAVAVARAHLAEARAWVMDSGEVEMALHHRTLAARVALGEGRADEARAEAEAGLAAAGSGGFGLFSTRLAAVASAAHLRAGDADGALAHARAACASAEAAGYAWGRADALHAAGLAHAARGERDAAGAALDGALALRTRLGHPGADATRAARADLSPSREPRSPRRRPV